MSEAPENPAAATPVPTRRSRRAFTPAWANQAAVRATMASLALCLAMGGVALAGVRLPPALSWLEGLTCVVAGVAACIVLTRRLPVQNVVGGGLVLLGLVFMTCALSARTGVPLGELEYTSRLGPRVLGLVPVTAPFLWVALMLSGREAARLMLRSLRREVYYGYYLLLAASLLVFLAALVLEPFAVTPEAGGWWAWTRAPSVSWQGIPWGSLGMWFLGAAFMLTVATAYLVPKRPIPTTPTLHGGLIWLGLVLWFALGDLRRGLWLPAAVGIGTSLIVAFLVWRGYQISLAAVSRRADAEAEAG
ncbi:MAG: carotenoid biosynthesis protein [Verrucomicrobiales bacterium]|nr:carotenoid biosynthesis protein [Verrucomicrobiales bacterium]